MPNQNIWNQLNPNSPIQPKNMFKTNFNAPAGPTVLPQTNNQWTPTSDQQAARIADWQKLYQYQAPSQGPLPPNIAPPPNANPSPLGPISPSPDPGIFFTPKPPETFDPRPPFVFDPANPDNLPSTPPALPDPLGPNLAGFEDAFNQREPLRNWDDVRRPDSEFDFQGPTIPFEGYGSTDSRGLANFPGFPLSLEAYAGGDKAVQANLEQEFLNIAQGFAQGNDAVTRRAIQVLQEEFNFPADQINSFMGELLKQSPYGAGQSVTKSREYGDPVINTGSVPGYAAAIPPYYKQNMTESEARTAQLYDLALQRQRDDTARAQQQEFLLTQKDRLDEDPLAMALQGDIMDRLNDPNSITDATKQRLFGELADTAAQQEQSQLSSLGSMLGGRGLEGSGLGAGLGAQFAQARQKALLDAQRNVEIQQALQSAQDRAAAQASANAFFQGREGLLGSIANNIASVGIGGDITHLAGEIPGMPSEIAGAEAIRRARSDDSGILGSILGSVGQLGGGLLGGLL